MVNLLWIYIPPREKSNFPDPFVPAWQKEGGGGGGEEDGFERPITVHIISPLSSKKIFSQTIVVEIIRRNCDKILYS